MFFFSFFFFSFHPFSTLKIILLIIFSLHCLWWEASFHSSCSLVYDVPFFSGCFWGFSLFVVFSSLIWCAYHGLFCVSSVFFCSGLFYFQDSGYMCIDCLYCPTGHRGFLPLLIFLFVLQTEWFLLTSGSQIPSFIIQSAVNLIQ